MRRAEPLYCTQLLPTNSAWLHLTPNPSSSARGLLLGLSIRAQACRYRATTTRLAEEGLRVFPVCDPVMVRASIAWVAAILGQPGRTGVGCTSPHPAASTCQLPRACDHTFGVGGSFSKTIRPSCSLAQLDSQVSPIVIPGQL